MPFVEKDGARIYWHAIGEGEPLVMIMGLGCSSAMWFRLAPLLARRYRVILLDNRGAGQTSVNYYVVHRVTTMAADVADVLAAAGETSAHVVGFSMGGMIAQEFALRHPGQVRSLTLMATNCGGAYAVLAEPKVWRLLFDKGDLSAEAALEAMRPYTYSRHTPRHLIEEDGLVRLSSTPPLRAYHAQLYGLIYWTSYSRLPQLRCPTLVMHGEEDALIPPQNGRNLASRIPSAVLVEIDRASHWLHTDQLDRVTDAVMGFLRKQPARSAR